MIQYEEEEEENKLTARTYTTLTLDRRHYPILAVHLHLYVYVCVRRYTRIHEKRIRDDEQRSTNHYLDAYDKLTGAQGTYLTRWNEDGMRVLRFEGQPTLCSTGLVASQSTTVFIVAIPRRGFLSLGNRNRGANRRAARRDLASPSVLLFVGH